MCWMDNGGKSCLKEFDLASILWPSVGKKNHQVICTCFPRVNPTQQRFNSWRWKTHFSIFYSCLLCAWSNKSIHWSAFPTLSAGHSLLYLFEFSISLSATMSFQEEGVAVICPRLSSFICHHCLLCRHLLPTEIREQKLWGPAGLVSGLWQTRVCW